MHELPRIVERVKAGNESHLHSGHEERILRHAERVRREESARLLWDDDEDSAPDLDADGLRSWVAAIAETVGGEG
jgi:hypothetical protein